MPYRSPEPYTAARAAGATITAAPAALAFVRRAVEEAGTLFDHARRHPEARRLEGRGPAYLVPAPEGGRWVVRHFRRGGALASRLGDRYLRLGTPRPLRELEASAAARARGVPTPEVAAAVVYPAGPFYRADIATVYVPDSVDLEAALFGALAGDARLEAARAAGRLVRRAHERGVLHADLNLKNILIQSPSAAPRGWLLDLDRCRVAATVPAPARRAMCERLERSYRKWSGMHGVEPDAAARAAFAEGYAEGDAHPETTP